MASARLRLAEILVSSDTAAVEQSSQPGGIPWSLWVADRLLEAGVTFEDPTEYEYGVLISYIDGWERGDRFDDLHYVVPLWQSEGSRGPDVRRRKAGPWERIEVRRG